MVKDRNKSTTVILRNFNCELIEKLKKFTGENTNTKAIELVCARYLGLEKLADGQREEIAEIRSSLNSVASTLSRAQDAKDEVVKFINYMSDIG
ncbi:MAG: hypothetical protein KAS17_04745 [Victivallaceae bacterium]|nr:hypothetical protein [Victivallaceae bacterium]